MPVAVGQAISPVFLGNSRQSYSELLRDTYNADEIWPLVDISSGTTINAFINSNRNGSLTGWDLQNTPGPVPGTFAPLSDGVNDFGNILTSNGTDGFVDIFDGTIGSLILWLDFRPTTWNSGGDDRPLNFNVNDGMNFIQLRKNNDVLRWTYMSGGVTKLVNLTPTPNPTGWFMMGMSWSNPDDEMKAYYNDAQTGATQTGLGAWTGSPATATIGAVSLTPTLVWDGWQAYCAVRFGNVWTDSDFAAIYNGAFTS